MIAQFSKIAVGLLLCAVSAVIASAEESAWRGPEVAGHLPAGMKESSGLAVSRREAGMFWTHGDSGGEPVLTAIGADGTLRGSVRIAGVKNVDWEDMASFTFDGRAWLLVADTGDNKGVRADCVLHVVAEPDPAKLTAGAERVVSVAWSIPVIYPDGARDCEAVAVDAREGRVYLVAKRTKPHGVYALPLRSAKAGAVAPAAERVGEMAGFPEARGAERMLPVARGAYRAQPTGMDFAADGSAAVVVTYGEVLLYPKTKDETWADALARPGSVIGSHGLEQAEAVAFGAGPPGSVATDIYVTSEGAGASVLRYAHEPR
ncbi:MAG: hypothetical protein H7067_06285 [Burkholderiales bacterium]|nr:hypothetical protein [Opitutaceae bacterium]